MSKTFSKSQISQHNTETSCWVVIKNKVYDLTEFIDKHPGGKSTIIKQAGEDGTSTFTSSHLDINANIVKMEKYCIGDYKEDTDLIYHFEACISKTEPVNNVFTTFLEKIESKEIFDCLDNIRVFKETESKEVANTIIKEFLEENSPKEINIDPQLRQEIVSKIQEESITKNTFYNLEQTLIYQLKTGVYHLFLSSDEFKIWISKDYQKNLLATMSTFMMDFGKEEQQEGKDCCIVS